jgi:hypothetical protein
MAAIGQRHAVTPRRVVRGKRGAPVDPNLDRAFRDRRKAVDVLDIDQRFALPFDGERPGRQPVVGRAIRSIEGDRRINPDAKGRPTPVPEAGVMADQPRLERFGGGFRVRLLVALNGTRCQDGQ